MIFEFDTSTIELESIPDLTTYMYFKISVRLTWHPPFWGWQGWCWPWIQTGGPVPGTGDRSCGAHTGWPGWRITACPGPSLKPTEQHHRVRQRGKILQNRVRQRAQCSKDSFTMYLSYGTLVCIELNGAIESKTILQLPINIIQC